MSDRLSNTLSKIDVSINDDVLCQWLALQDDDKRLFALMTIRQKAESDATPPPQYFGIAKEYLNDQDNDCKWQAFIIIGNFMVTKPEECWQVIMESGDSNDDDTRAAVATILPEHYFEQNPHLFRTKIKEIDGKIAAGHQNFLQTLTLCRSDWGNESNHLTVQNLIKEAQGKP